MGGPVDGIRSPAVAGTFYPDDPGELRALVEDLLDESPRSHQTYIGAIVPHAGLQYSGSCAARVFGRLHLPPVVVVLAPNHTGAFSPTGCASAWPDGVFRSPLGDVEVAREFVNEWSSHSGLLDAALEPHLSEHAIEVELPFLSTIRPDVTIVPVVLPWADWDHCRALGESLAAVVEDWPEQVLLIASSDMNHYESAEIAKRKDERAIEAIERLDGEALLRRCRDFRITMCGRAPSATVLRASALLGATSAEVIDYRHSGLINGNHERVVSYAGILIR